MYGKSNDISSWPASAGRLLYRFRWLAAALALALAVAFELHGSSVGLWSVFVPDTLYTEQGLIAGQDRPIRSDEWAVFTPMALSQYYNDFGLTSDILRATETDVYMVYGQPVRDWSIIFRPFQAGYLFLSPARGLSFYWAGKLIALLLVSFEFGLLITGRNKGISLAYAFLTALAPVVQWWFSVNAFPDMLVYGQGIVLCVYHYMRSPSYARRAACALGFVWLGGAYLLVLYPAWQIPFFYVFAAVGVWTILENRRGFSFRWKKDVPILAAAALLLAASMAVIVARSWDAISAVMNSVYPGTRRERGGMGVSPLLRYVANLFFPFTDQNVPDNVCEQAAFCDLFPLGLLLSGFALYQGKRRDVLTVALLCACAFLGLYVAVGFPGFLADITLLNQAKAGRAAVALSYANLLLVIRATSRLQTERIRPRWTRGLAFALLAAGGAVCASYLILYREYLTPWMALACFAAVFALYAAAIYGGKCLCVLAVAFSLLAGATVNPLRTGLAVLEDSRLGREIAEIAARDDAAWLAVSDHWVMGNYPIMYGAKTVNSTNTYMNGALWEKLDPEGEYTQVYNRYVHPVFSLSNTESTRAELLQDELMLVRLNTGDLQKMGVKYILSEKDISQYNGANAVFERIYDAPGVQYGIYRVLEGDPEE